MANQSNKNLTALLEALGRASTPQVKPNRFGISAASFLGTAMFPSEPDSTLLLGTQEMLSTWPRNNNVVLAVPGLIKEQIVDQKFSRLVIDESAFHRGPWIGTDSGGQSHLASELFEAGRIARGTGRAVYFVPTPSSGPKFDSAYIRSTCTVDFSNIPAEDLEEGAPQSEVWDFLLKLVADRYGMK